jgi:hypothetical protein
MLPGLDYPRRKPMSILEKLKKISHRETGIRDFCIQTIRFKKFLENARSLLDLFEDGREKFWGEYIFDRHYVVSLIDSVVEQLGMMVYDACVLASDSGEALYAAYDRHKLAAANLIESNGSRPKSGPSESQTGDMEDPEYRLLSDALHWFNGKDAPANTTVMDLMKKIFFFVIQSLESPGSSENKALLEKSGMLAADKDFYLVDLWKDALALPETKRSMSDVQSVPLRHLLMDAGGTGGREKGDFQKSGPWVAAVSEYQLSLNTLNSDVRFRLDTLASGYEPSDFIFVFADPSVNLDALLPKGFQVENSDYGRFAWNLDISAKTIEDSLMVIGRNLFG